MDHQAFQVVLMIIRVANKSYYESIDIVANSDALENRLISQTVNSNLWYQHQTTYFPFLVQGI